MTLNDPVATFLQISTLQDQFSRPVRVQLDRLLGRLDERVFYGKDQVDALFALGQYLVYYHCAEIAEGLTLDIRKACKEDK